MALAEFPPRLSWRIILDEPLHAVKHGSMRGLTMEPLQYPPPEGREFDPTGFQQLVLQEMMVEVRDVAEEITKRVEAVLSQDADPCGENGKTSTQTRPCAA